MSLDKEQFEGFAKFFEEPKRETLREVIKKNIGETNYFDFKKEWPELSQIAKHVLALSNSGGGALIIGIEEKKDGTYESVGISKILDKADINKKLKNYLPNEVDYCVLDFHYKESEYPAIKEKKFQVILVKYKVQFIPFLSLKEGKGIKANAVYIRRGTNSDEANHEELQKILNERIETGYSSKHILNLSEHLDQLKNLYTFRGKSFSFAVDELFNHPMGEFKPYIAGLIERKKNIIEKELKIQD